MAGDWIKVETVTPGKPEVHAIAEICKIEPEHALGCLVCLWIWADQQTVDGNAPRVTKALLDRYTSVTGFADAMLQVGWLVKTDGGFVFPNFGLHNGSTAKQRAQTHKRVLKNRAKKDVANSEPCNAPSVTKALPEIEKRREEKREEITSTSAEKPKKNVEYSNEFHQFFWNHYKGRNGRKVGKEKCFKLFNQIAREEWPLLQQACKIYREEVEPEFYKDPERFLKNGVWRDYLAPKDTTPRVGPVDQKPPIRGAMPRLDNGKVTV